MADEGLDPFRGRILRPGHIYTEAANAAEEIEIENLPGDFIRNPFYVGKELEQKIEEIIQQKLSDLLLSHVCPICKKQLEEE